MNVIKKIIICLLVASMLLSFGAVFADDTATDKATDTATDTATSQTSTDKDTSSDKDSSSDKDDEEKTYRTEEEAFADMKKIAETDDLELWFNESQIHFALKVKATGYTWWSEPYDADFDENAKLPQIRDLKSSFIITNTVDSTSLNSYLQCVDKNKKGDKVICQEIDGGVKITYKFPAAKGFEIPIEYKLDGDHFTATVLGSGIKESKKDAAEDAYQLTSISLLPNFGAADKDTNGYMVVPDGCGAVINYNNGKSTFTKYSAPVYGRDITATLTTRQTPRQQVYMPVIGLVNDGNALMEVCTSGAECANVNAYVAGQNTTSYNAAYFSFTLRAKDTYYVAGNLQKPLDMYEGAKAKFTDYSVSYYPLKDKNATYNEIAKRYRDYLTEEEKVEKKAETKNDTVYLTFYGGTYRKTSILGIPVNVKTAATTYEQAEKILQELLDEGVKDIVVNYVDWNDDAISKKICNDVNISGKLGGKSDFEKLQKFAEENGIKIYYDMEISVFSKSGNGFNKLFNATACLTKSYSRQTDYDISWDIEAYKPNKWSILTPSSFTKVFDSIASSFSKKGIKNVSIGSVSTTLYSHYGKNPTTRYEMADIVFEGCKKLSSEVGSVMGKQANQYLWSNMDVLTGMPLYSSRFDVFDYDIPFMQLCIHGLVPYSIQSINANADSDELFVLAAATASNLGYEFLYEENKKLQNTAYNEYYYANFKGWSKTVAGQYKMFSSIISELSDKTIDKYEVNGNVLKSTFSDGTVIEVNKETNTIKVNGKELKYADFGL